MHPPAPPLELPLDPMPPVPPLQPPVPPLQPPVPPLQPPELALLDPASPPSALPLAPASLTFAGPPAWPPSPPSLSVPAVPESAPPLEFPGVGSLTHRPLRQVSSTSQPPSARHSAPSVPAGGLAESVTTRGPHELTLAKQTANRPAPTEGHSKVIGYSFSMLGRLSFGPACRLVSGSHRPGES